VAVLLLFVGVVVAAAASALHAMPFDGDDGARVGTVRSRMKSLILRNIFQLFFLFPPETRQLGLICF
jgi:hypothetical protein